MCCFGLFYKLEGVSYDYKKSIDVLIYSKQLGIVVFENGFQ